MDWLSCSIRPCVMPLVMVLFKRYTLTSLLETSALSFWYIFACFIVKRLQRVELRIESGFHFFCSNSTLQYQQAFNSLHLSSAYFALLVGKSSTHQPKQFTLADYLPYSHELYLHSVSIYRKRMRALGLQG